MNFRLKVNNNQVKSMLDGKVKRLSRRILYSAMSNMVDKAVVSMNRRSLSRHKWANMTGKQRTNQLVFRKPMDLISYNDPTTGQIRGDIDIDKRKATYTMKGIPFLKRAFKPLNISAKNAKYMPVPISSETKGKKNYLKLGIDYDKFVFKKTKKGNLAIFKKDWSSFEGGKRIRHRSSKDLKLIMVLCKTVNIKADYHMIPKKQILSRLLLEGANKALKKR